MARVYLLLFTLVSNFAYAGELAVGDLALREDVTVGAYVRVRILDRSGDLVKTSFFSSLQDWVRVEDLVAYRPVEMLQDRSLADRLWNKPGTIYRVGDWILTETYRGMEKAQIEEMVEPNFVQIGFDTFDRALFVPTSNIKPYIPASQ